MDTQEWAVYFVWIAISNNTAFNNIFFRAENNNTARIWNHCTALYHATGNQSGLGKFADLKLRIKYFVYIHINSALILLDFLFAFFFCSVPSFTRHRRIFTSAGDRSVLENG